MFCKYCGKRLPDGSETCVYCGRAFEKETTKKLTLEEKLSRLEKELEMDDFSEESETFEDVEPQPSRPVKERKKTQKTKWIILSVCGAAVIVIICVVIVLMSTVFSPVNKVLGAVQRGDWENAKTLYSQITSQDSLNDVAYQLTQYTDKVMDDWRGGTLSAADALERLNHVKDFNITYLSEKLSKYIAELNSKTNAEELFKKGEESYNNQNYADAIGYLSQVSDYPNAQELLNQATEKYRKQYLSQAAELADKDDYEGAIDKLRDALKLIQDDQALLNKIEEYCDSYVDHAIRQAEALAKKEDFDRADKLLAQAIDLFPDRKELYDKRSGIAAMKAVDLIDVCAPYAGGGCTVYKKGSSFKIGADSYSPGFIINNTGFADDNEAYAEVNLDKKYKTLTLSVGLTDVSAQGNLSVHIYADNKQIRQCEIDEELQTVTVSVEGVSVLRFVILSDTDGMECGFANMKLKK